MRLRRLDGLAARHGRSKRAILGFLGKLSKLIFGTATEADVEDVKRVLNNIGNQEQDLIHNVNELWSMVNGTREYVRQNRVMLFSLSKHTSRLRELINWTIERDRQLTVHIRSLQFTHVTDRAIQHLEFMEDHFSLHWNSYILKLTEASGGRLTRRLVPVSVMKQERARMTAQGYDVLPMDWYYIIYGSSRTFVLKHAPDSMTIVVNLPTIDRARYLFYSLFYFPVAFSENNWRRIVGAPAVMVSTVTGTKFKPTDCVLGDPIVCPNRVQYNELCEFDLIQGSKLTCPVDIFPARHDTIVTLLTQTQLVVSALRPTLITERCSAQEPTRYKVHSILIHTLRPKCQWNGDSWSYITPSHFIEEVAVNYSIKYLPLPPLNMTWPSTAPPPVVDALEFQASVRIAPLETLKWRKQSDPRPLYLPAIIPGALVPIVLIAVTVGIAVYCV